MTLCSMDCPITKLFHIFNLRNIYNALSGNFTHLIFSNKCSSEWLTVRVASAIIELDKHLNTKFQHQLWGSTSCHAKNMDSSYPKEWDEAFTCSYSGCILGEGFECWVLGGVSGRNVAVRASSHLSNITDFIYSACGKEIPVH